MKIETVNNSKARQTHFAQRLVLLISLAVCSPLIASENDRHNENSRTLELSPRALDNAALTTAVAGAGEVDQQLTLYGKLLPEPTAVSHIRARYPGVVSEVNVHIGDEVKKDQLLASIHSNESMREYQLRAPFAGMVIAKHAGPGEFVSDQVLFQVADYSRLWAELQVFPARLQRVKPGQTVTLQSGEHSTVGQVRSLVPAGDEFPYARARVMVSNTDGRWMPGIFVRGRVQLEKKTVALVVDNRALQELDGDSVVFVQIKPGHFEAQSVQLGERGSAYSEVRTGLRPGERYVVDNSYLLKAELEKSAAGHAH
ncbi:efflux RND transporter periplasmic adaptor subunit [Microbulbifer pacificus]|uniref:efflux RND transporter periplasmic adaptor subunit n=1 Tax=Microbulbifer pacificus TaxID=407164 RepID=UPI001319C4B7|nr:efflux RND transporter periplasmic adaptor subunit [Microbulbifer pacificus]